MFGMRNTSKTADRINRRTAGGLGAAQESKKTLVMGRSDISKLPHVRAAAYTGCLLIRRGVPDAA